MIRMLYDAKTGAFSSQGLVQILMLIPIVLISLTLHEIAHGYAAYKCGDNTAKAFGRLTLNPLSHLDLFGTLMMFFIGFGWAKPVPINTRNFRKPRRDLFIVSIAGVAVNLLLGLIGVLIMYANLKFAFLPDNVTIAIVNFFYLFAIINIGLAVFNLIPLPPLDGSKILSTLLSPRASAKYLRIEYYARYVLLGIIILSWLPEPFRTINRIIWYPINWARAGIFDIFSKFANLIFPIF